MGVVVEGRVLSLVEEEDPRDAARVMFAMLAVELEQAKSCC